MQVLTWDVPGGIAASESILVEVYDWERFGKHKYHCMPQLLINSQCANIKHCVTVISVFVVVEAIDGIIHAITPVSLTTLMAAVM